MEKIHEIRDRFDLAILLIEHNMELVMGICERILVLNFGKTIAQGTADEVRSNPVVIEAYLGEPAASVQA
jgi:branched-chain amino acid transport system ATP-binding protein